MCVVMVVSNIFFFSNIQPVKGLQYAQNCSSNTRSRCGCQSGMYCIMTFDAPYCEACAKYRSCKVGYGVSVPGTALIFQQQPFDFTSVCNSNMFYFCKMNHLVVFFMRAPIITANYTCQEHNYGLKSMCLNRSPPTISPLILVCNNHIVKIIALYPLTGVSNVYCQTH